MDFEESNGGCAAAGLIEGIEPRREEADAAGDGVPPVEEDNERTAYDWDYAFHETKRILTVRMRS